MLFVEQDDRWTYKTVDPGEGRIVPQKIGKEKHSGEDSEFREEAETGERGPEKSWKRRQGETLRAC